MTILTETESEEISKIIQVQDKREGENFQFEHLYQGICFSNMKLFLEPSHTGNSAWLLSCKWFLILSQGFILVYITYLVLQCQDMLQRWPNFSVTLLVLLLACSSSLCCLTPFPSAVLCILLQEADTKSGTYLDYSGLWHFWLIAKNIKAHTCKVDQLDLFTGSFMTMNSTTESL